MVAGGIFWFILPGALPQHSLFLSEYKQPLKPTLHVCYVASVVSDSEFYLLWSFLAMGGVVHVACQGFLLREACVGVLVG